ncbi:DCL family protein [Nocardiopsis sp. EMB25]|uniref:DCL family protein n=1 Tax=Nocardiopsis sp. EMB25 TaxID=2835867 RepID=UPI002284445B|nr:DCL family protein [Nocardiopsis sp. EMB25]MCY9785160.1 DCL family protein [Nocardiopsis sp. EMB25]
MAAQPIPVGGRWFPSKTAAKAECKRILHHYEIGTSVTEPEDEQFLLDLVQMHSDPPRKIGPGIERFEVRANPQYPRSRSFFIIRTGGTEDDLGYTKLIDGQTHAQRVAAAMRHEIKSQIEDFRAAEFARADPVKCQIEDTEIAHPGDCHVDHEDPEFYELVQRFVDQCGGWDAFELMSLPAGKGEIAQRFTNGEIASQWCAYHFQEAKLRIVSVQANLSTLRKGKRFPG